MSKMAILRVKDKDGNVVDIPAIRGPKGDPGEPGKDGKDAPTLYQIGQMIYPVGSVYISVAATDPTEIFGGVWQRIKDRFLLAGGDRFAAGSDGGEAEHVLEEAEMPVHAHGERLRVYGHNEWPEYTTEGYGIAFNYTAVDQYYGAGSTFHSSTVGAYTSTGEKGAGAAHNNMPPYLAVYMWVRVG